MTRSSFVTRLVPLAAATAAITLLTSGVAGAADSPGSVGSTGSSASTGSTGSLGSLGSTGPVEPDPLTFDGWDTCPIADPDVATCATVLVRDGSVKIGNLTVPLPDGSLKIAGGLKYEFKDDGSFDQVFVPAPGTNHGVTANPINVPGGALGIDTPLGLTQITAEVEALGTPKVDLFTFSLDLPVRLKLSNPLLGDHCYIGSADKPINFALRTPNQTGNDAEAIGDHPGAVFRAIPHGDDTFAVPGPEGCGGGLLDWAVNLRAGTPSSAGKNSIETVSDIYNVGAYEVEPPA